VYLPDYVLEIHYKSPSPLLFYHSNMGGVRQMIWLQVFFSELSSTERGKEH